jgi:hypothetical protein
VTARRWLPISATVVAVAALVLAFLGYLALDAGARDRATRDFPKLAYQFLLVGVLGVYANFLIQRYRDRLAREEAASELREETAGRLVGITVRVRKAQVLLALDRSKKTYDEQVRDLIHAAMDLREIDHEIETRQTFSDDRIRPAVGHMVSSLESLVAELRKSRRDFTTPRWLRPEGRAFRDAPLLRQLFAEVLPKPEDSLFDQRYLTWHRSALDRMRAEIMRLG